jgi:PAS domain S-box-containing protein
MKDQAASQAPQNNDVAIDAAEEVLRQHCDFLYRLTRQTLESKNLDDYLLLVLKAVTSELGYSHAAIALADRDSGKLRIRLALGFPEDEKVIGTTVSVLGSGAPAGIGGKAAWIRRRNDASESRFLEGIQSSSDLLALPLPGLEWCGFGKIDSAGPPCINTHVSGDNSRCMGVLYVAWSDGTAISSQLNLLLRLADRVGLTIAMAEQNARLATAIARLEREREWVNAITQSVADPIVLTDLENQILLQNKRAEELFSGSEKENSSESKLSVLKMNDLLFSAYLSSVSFSNTEVTGRDLKLVEPIKGSEVHFEVVSTPACDSNGERTGTVSVFRDVTGLRKANEEMIRNVVKLQQAEAQARDERDRLNLIIENVGHPVVVSDANGNLFLFNRKAETYFEQTDDPPPATVAAIRTNAVKLMSFISGLASAPGAERQAEIELIDPESGNVLPMEITSVEITGTRGQVTVVVSILHDLSGIRELERRRVQQQFFESEKLAAIGRLTASIAHEINNPLEAIKNSLFLIQNSETETSKRFLEIALKETERVSQIIAQMLGFTRNTSEVESVNINDLLDETLVLVDKKLKQSGTRVVREFQMDLPTIRARADQLRQVFLNLLLNAQQSIPGRGRITVKTSQLSGSVEPWISVEISDTGIGISDEDLMRIFEPFFSTRKKGTGLGLWVTQDLVRHHGGRIEVTSVVHRGTTFRIVLPLEPPPEQAKANPRAALSA